MIGQKLPFIIHKLLLNRIETCHHAKPARLKAPPKISRMARRAMKSRDDDDDCDWAAEGLSKVNQLKSNDQLYVLSRSKFDCI